MRSALSNSVTTHWSGSCSLHPSDETCSFSVQVMASLGRIKVIEFQIEIFTGAVSLRIEQWHGTDCQCQRPLRKLQTEWLSRDVMFTDCDLVTVS